MDKFQKNLAVQLEELDRLADQQPLAFLGEAAIAYDVYNKQMRKESRRLRSGSVTALDVYSAWLGEYLPHIEKIQQNVALGKFQRPLKTVLLVCEESTSRWMSHEIVRLCATKARDDIRRAVCLKSNRACQTLEDILGRDDAKVTRQAKAAINYQQYKTIAKKHGFVVYDRHMGLLRRTLSKLRTRRQEKKIVNATKLQLQDIAEQTSEIAGLHCGIIPRLNELGVDLISVLAARQAYEKALKKLSPSPTEKLHLYEEKTAKIRAPYLNSRTDLENIQDVQTAAQQIDEVLMTVFGLDMTDKNTLVTSMKQYRELIETQQTLKTKLSRTRSQDFQS